jgi:hypothetical protein
MNDAASSYFVAIRARRLQEEDTFDLVLAAALMRGPR